MLCSEHISINRSAVEGAVSVLRCKRWNCEICQPYNRRRVIAAASRGKPGLFLTLTSRVRDDITPDEAARALKEAWVTLRRRIHVRYGIKNLPFLVVFERTKRGWPHLHMMIRAKWLDQRWLSEQMSDLIDSPQVFIEKIDAGRGCAKYVAKYLGKDPHAFAGCKRWWRSHNYEQVPPDDRPAITFGERWQTERRSIGAQRDLLTSIGFEIHDERPGFFTFRLPS